MKIKDGYLLRNIADEWIIVPIGARIHDFNGLMTVNETGAFLWCALVDGCSQDDLINALMSEYDVDIETAESDVQEFIDSLTAGDVVTK